MRFYRIAGLRVDSEFPLHGTIPDTSDNGEIDVRVVRAAIPAHLDGAAAVGPTWEMAGRRFLLRIPGVARFLLRDGWRVEVDPDPDGDPGDIPIFIIGTVFGLLLHQRRRVVLHGSAVRVNDRAVLFCGPSGAGKSTLAAALVQRGFPLVSDDVVSLSLDAGGRPVIYPDGRTLKLWQSAIEQLNLSGRKGAAVRQRLEKFYVQPEIVHSDALPLGAVYSLAEERQGADQPGIAEANCVDAALLIRRNAYRPQMVARMGQKADYFQASVAMMTHAGVFTLTRTLDFARMEDVTGWLTDHWRGIGLMDAA